MERGSAAPARGDPGAPLTDDADPFAPFLRRNAPSIRQPVPGLDDDPDGFFQLLFTDRSFGGTLATMRGDAAAMTRLEVRSDRVVWTPPVRSGAPAARSRSSASGSSAAGSSAAGSGSSTSGSPAAGSSAA